MNERPGVPPAVLAWVFIALVIWGLVIALWWIER